MKYPALVLVICAFCSLNLFAQSLDEAVHAPDGGTLEHFNSILLPPVPHAPFSSNVTAE